MYNIPFVIRRFLKSKNLRIVNLLGLALMFGCILVSYTYVKRELSYDRFYSNADRIVRMAVRISFLFMGSGWLLESFFRL